MLDAKILKEFQKKDETKIQRVYTINIDVNNRRNEGAENYMSILDIINSEKELIEKKIFLVEMEMSQENMP